MFVAPPPPLPRKLGNLAVVSCPLVSTKSALLPLSCYILDGQRHSTIHPWFSQSFHSLSASQPRVTPHSRHGKEAAGRWSTTRAAAARPCRFENGDFAIVFLCGGREAAIAATALRVAGGIAGVCAGVKAGHSLEPNAEHPKHGQRQGVMSRVLWVFFFHLVMMLCASNLRIFF